MNASPAAAGPSEYNRERIVQGEIILNETNEDVDFAVTEIDLAKVDVVRTAESAHLRDRRPDVYRMA